MNLEARAREFVLEYIDFILDNANIQQEFEYDIIDEYDNSVETMQMPVNYKIIEEEEKVYIISINDKGLDQHKKHRQF